MDMNKEYGDVQTPLFSNPSSLCPCANSFIGGNNLEQSRSLLSTVAPQAFTRTYQQNDYTGTVPTLQDFRAELLKQDEPEAKEIALAIELITHGSLTPLQSRRMLTPTTA
jgi:hypothetical protein